MKLIVLFFVFLFSIYISTSALFAQGKSQNSPGQMKKEVTVGHVEEVKKNSVVVENKKDKSIEESVVDNKTKVVGSNKKTLKLKDIKRKDIIAIVSSDGAQLATSGGKLKKALKVFVKEASVSAQMKRRAVHGIITAINGPIITLVHQIQQDRTYIVQVGSDTIIKTKQSENGTLSVGQRIVAIGDLGENGVLIARRIHIIPGLAKGVFKKNPIATISATLTPSITGTPSASITPIATPSSTLTPSPTSTLSATPTPTP